MQCLVHARSPRSMLKQHKGFTLIELLVVIAIIGFLATLAVVSFGKVRASARDVKKQADFKHISTALYRYLDLKGRMPNNYNPAGVCEGSADYVKSMQELVDAELLPAIPKSPGPGGSEYCFYNYGPGTIPGSIGVLLRTSLEVAPDTITGLPPSCRPWAAGTNWCDQKASKEFCICNTY